MILAKSQTQSEMASNHWSEGMNVSICDELLIIQGCPHIILQTANK